MKISEEKRLGLETYHCDYFESDALQRLEAVRARQSLSSPSCVLSTCVVLHCAYSKVVCGRQAKIKNENAVLKKYFYIAF